MKKSQNLKNGLLRTAYSVNLYYLALKKCSDQENSIIKKLKHYYNIKNLTECF